MASIIRKNPLIISCALFFALISGCARLDNSVDNLLNEQPEYINIADRTVCYRPIEYSVHGSGDYTVLVIGAIHGDEPESAALVTELQDYLTFKPQPLLLVTRRIVVLPVANPDGLAIGTRTNANGVDLNRNFATANRINSAETGFNSLTEPESLALKRLIDKYMPDRIISVHQSLGCVDYDGPALQVAEAVSAASGLPVQKLGAMPGSLGSYAGETLNIPIITLELPPDVEGLDKHAIWQSYRPALLTAIEFPQ